jgi:threonine dehydratase
LSSTTSPSLPPDAAPVRNPVVPAGLADIRDAQQRLTPLVLRSPLVRCAQEPAGCEVFLKLENLQPSGAFKLRPVGNAVLARSEMQLAAGVYTASSGNSALALAWLARRLEIAASAVVPTGAPEAKLARLQELGARIITQSPADWWQTVADRGCRELPGLYIDAVRDPLALAGNGTLGLEILEQLPGVDAIFVPFGGGALACGVACAARAINAAVKIIVCEPDGAQPFGAAYRAGRPVTVASNPGFISGVGFHTLLPEMWPLCRELIDGALTVSLAEVAAAIRLLAARNQVVAEGAGAIAVAAAVAGRHPFRRVCAVVSGGNVGVELLTQILSGAIAGQG